MSSPSKAGSEDEMLKHLDLLLNFEVIENEDLWEKLKFLEEIPTTPNTKSEDSEEDLEI